MWDHKRAVAAVFSMAVFAGIGMSRGAVEVIDENAIGDNSAAEVAADVRFARIAGAGADAAATPVRVSRERAVMLQVAAEPAPVAELEAEPAAESEVSVQTEGDLGSADVGGTLGDDVSVVNTLDSDGKYQGGRGLITLQGMSGMFLNPTSGTLDQGQLAIQYCVLFNDYSTKLVGHGVMVDYGVTDWLNVGGFGTIADLEGVDVFASEPIAAGGPFFRARLVKEVDDSWVPEVSVGGIYLDGGKNGDGVFYKAEAFVAASKGFEIDPDGFVREIRGHLGFRGGFRDEAPEPNDDFAFGYGGVEFYLPYSFSLIGEISTADIVQDAGQNVPYAIGVQWKPSGVLGLSAAHMNPGGGFAESFWFGVGLNFNF